MQYFGSILESQLCEGHYADLQLPRGLVYVSHLPCEIIFYVTMTLE